MKPLQIKTNPAVKSTFEKYPPEAQEKLSRLRKLIVEVAEESELIETLEETLKWNEPSYLTKHGSTIRMDWKKKQPEQYALYFQCSSLLVPTFREGYKDRFDFEGKRAIIFQMDDELPVEELKNCIRAGLTYHKVKHLPLLGL
jgi:hypothetical protein